MSVFVLFFTRLVLAEDVVSSVVMKPESNAEFGSKISLDLKGVDINELLNCSLLKAELRL